MNQHYSPQQTQQKNVNHPTPAGYYQGVPSPYHPPYPNMRQIQASEYDRERLKMIESNNVLKRLRDNNELRGVKVEPEHIRFATQNVDEKIYIYARRHWSENLEWMIRNTVFFFLPLLLVWLAHLLSVEIDFLSPREYFIILLCFYSLIVTNIFKDFFDWYFDPYIITNQRVLHYEFKPFTKYKVKETALESIENVSEQSAGLIAGLWGYGTITISTEAQDDLFIFKRISKPIQVRDILSDLTRIAQKYRGDNS